MENWYNDLTKTVGRWLEDSSKKLIEAVMSSETPGTLMFEKSDICSLLDQTVIGFLTTVPVEKKALTTIREEEVSFQIVVPIVVFNLPLISQESGESTSWTVGSSLIAKWSEDR